LLATVYGTLDLGDTIRFEYGSREFTEFLAYLRLRERPVKITPVTFAPVRAVAAVLQRDSYAGRPQARRG